VSFFLIRNFVIVSLAYALATTRPRSRVGLLDLDVFGPSIPKLMGLEGLGEPEMTSGIW
jgi:ATP-binding protein involved in chromosome partitioning